MLEREIRAEIVNLKGKLKDERAQLGPLALDESDSQEWTRFLASLGDDVKHINKKINDYNLVVPLLQKQLVHVNLNRLAEKCLSEEPSRTSSSAKRLVDQHHPSSTSQAAGDSGFLLTLFSAVFKQHA